LARLDATEDGTRITDSSLRSAIDAPKREDDRAKLLALQPLWLSLEPGRVLVDRIDILRRTSILTPAELGPVAGVDATREYRRASHVFAKIREVESARRVSKPRRAK